MFEVEVKFRVDDLKKYEEALEKFGALFVDVGEEEDYFFRNDALGFPDQGKMLRIRRRGSYLATTFKGPKLDATTKTREEIELPLVTRVSSASETRDALVERMRREWTTFYERLGFEHVETVRKFRREAYVSFGMRAFTITVDTLDELGTFTELETIAEESEVEEAREVVLRFAEELGLTEPIVKSYLALLIESRTHTVVDEK